MLRGGLLMTQKLILSKMTHNEFHKLPFRVVLHTSLATEHLAAYKAETPHTFIHISFVRRLDYYSRAICCKDTQKCEYFFWMLQKNNSLTPYFLPEKCIMFQDLYKKSLDWYSPIDIWGNFATSKVDFYEADSPKINNLILWYSHSLDMSYNLLRLWLLLRSMKVWPWIRN